ncbi:MAG: POT family MFS transporter [Verrucomicrobiota bacterium]
MANSNYRTAPRPVKGMPPGIPYIVGNEAAERFSYYGMRGILTVFMVKYLFLMDSFVGDQMNEAQAKEYFHWFAMAAYLTPLLGGILSDWILGKYRTIILLSLGYCIGHALLAMMGMFWSSGWLLFMGLAWIAIGSGGIKPCVSAHVGDQFGETNKHLVTRVFNYFYWSINFGAFLAHALTPWILHWYGPHWAFGIPGVLMALALFVFWLGRNTFVHIPARGNAFWEETFSPEGLAAAGKLCVIFLFVAIFWTLFDQTSSTWVLQADDMNRQFLGMTWLPSQIQLVNPVLILIFIPLFTFVIYPAINKFFPLTPMRKMSIGFFVMTIGFGITAVAQELIDAGQTPSIAWQLIAWAVVTPAEVMISIVCLEFAYTQAPKKMKSLIMGLFFCSVALGNMVTAVINLGIQTPDTLGELKAESGEVIDAGYDRKEGTADDVIARFEKKERQEVEFQSKALLDEAAVKITDYIKANDLQSPSLEEGQQLLEGMTDTWGNPLRYKLLARTNCRISSDGPDEVAGTRWDEGINITFSIPEPEKDGFMKAFEPDEPWLTRRKRELNYEENEESDDGIGRAHFVGGQIKLEGAPYFWLFTIMVGVTAIGFVVVAWFYKPKEYLHEEEE